MKNRRRKRLLGTSLQRKLLVLIIIAAVAPASIIAVCLYYLIFNLFAWQLGIPEAVAYNLLPVAERVGFILLVGLPIILTVIWIVAVKVSHRIAGPLYRLEKEIEEIVSGRKSGPIKLRKDDELHSFASKINKLIKG